MRQSFQKYDISKYTIHSQHGETLICGYGKLPIDRWEKPGYKWAKWTMKNTPFYHLIVLVGCFTVPHGR